MKIITTQPYKIIYTILNHEYLGYLLEAFVVQLDAKGQLTLLNQNVSSQNIKEFSEYLQPSDFEIVKLIDSIQQEAIFKKYGGLKKKNVVEFFLKTFDAQKGDKALQEVILGYVSNIKTQLMTLLLENKQLFLMGGDGNPTWQEVQIMPQKASVLFHFYRNEANTHYFPTIKYDGQKIEFQFKNAFILSDEPAWLVVENKLYHFNKDVDGKKLRPFLSKRFIEIPKKLEDDYYRKFVANIITLFDVYAKGFEIKSEAYQPVAQLSIAEANPVEVSQAGIFDNDNENIDNEPEGVQVVFNLSFRYGEYFFRFDSFSAPANVSMEKRGSDYVFHKVKRDLRLEKEKVLLLKNWGLDLRTGRFALNKSEAFMWLQSNYEKLQNAGIQLSQKVEATGKRYFLGYSRIEVNINEKRDWFDIEAKVQFGEFEIPFLKLRNLIIQKKREFVLPNGEIAVIPEAWFTQYAGLFAFVEHLDEHDNLILKKHHLALVEELHRESLATAVLSRKLEKLKGDFAQIDEYELPKAFKGQLRPYQKAGYDWMRFLNEFNFGGCLADDMGLGKTAQSLALLASQKDENESRTSLIVMPTSLIYNWQMEATKFAPELRVYIYTGTYRDKNIAYFADYDIVLTSYGIVRLDIDILKKFRFHYAVLDESQAIKNPTSFITKAVMQLNTRHRLTLTGTPLENSTMDLWSQMTFLNDGLLGSQGFFRNEFAVPIERKSDEAKVKQLYGLIKPFMLRRHKSQVATELPPKIEAIHYSSMTDQQEKEYEEAKSFYRNKILEAIETDGIGKSQLVVLQGLTKLRQLANHPRMTDTDYEGDSGKLDDVFQKLETILEEGHKVLIFSQFVKHLELFRERLDALKTDYAYLDGSTYDRQSEVEKFQKNDEIKIFLISLKAGGLGLNLTAADYVFILDPWWNPAIEAQAIDRAHRIGQQKTVFTYKFITKNTVEEKILALQQSKQKLANELITTEEGFVKSLSKDDLLTLLD
jgi:SNF2 family DNA or RNA helicase